jgi:hypothetical protein
LNRPAQPHAASSVRSFCSPSHPSRRSDA